MRKCFIFIAYLSLIQSGHSIAEEPNPQCEMIANLTADYYQHRQNGLNKQQVEEQFRPPFGNAEFQRTVNLAITMAFSLPANKDHNTVIHEVYNSCVSYQ